jgi:DNA-binding transcriptional LysR family regulator
MTDRLLALRAFVRAAHGGSFSRAARELGLSQPSVHRAARDLERLIGIELFEASRQGVDLTPTAKSFARHAALAHAELRQGLAEVSASLSLDPGTIVVGAMPFVRTRLLPDALNALSRARPRAHVKVITAPYDDLLDHLRHGAIDFLVGALREPAPIADVVQEALFEDPLSVVARADHPLARRNRVEHADLLDYPWAVPGAETPTRAVFRRLFSSGEEARMPGGMIETSSLVLLRGVLCGSDRLTIISARQAWVEIEQGQLAVVPYKSPFGARRIGLTFRRDWRPTATQALLIDHIRQASAEV